MSGPESIAPRLGFEHETRRIPIAAITALVPFRPSSKLSAKYRQILASVSVLGMVEAPVVIAEPKRRGRYLLLDGALRLEALKERGITEVDCLMATDDEAYTYNKQLSGLAVVQKQRMIERAVKSGVPVERIAQALNLSPKTIQEHFRLLEGICPEVVEALADKPCTRSMFDRLRQMKPLRQMEVVDIMVSQKNYSTAFAETLLVSTRAEDRVARRRKPMIPEGAREQLARFERELAMTQAQSRIVEETYSADNLHLTLAKRYLEKLLGKARIVRWLAQHHAEILQEFQVIAELPSAAEVRPVRGVRTAAVG